MGHCLVCVVESVNIFLKAQALLKRSASTFSSFSALLHLVFTSPTNWERHGWYIRPLSRRALCTPPRDLGTPDKTTHSLIGYDQLNINNPASGSTPVTLTRSGPRPWSLSGMFILCPLFHNYSALPWWNSARLVMENVRAERGIQGCGWWLLTKLL